MASSVIQIQFLTINEPSNITLSANNGQTVNVTPTLPNGKFIRGATVIFEQPTHVVLASISRNGTDWILGLRNFSSVEQSVKGEVRYFIA